MRVSITTFWSKFAVVAMTVVALSAMSFADDKDNSDTTPKESNRERILKERRLSTIAKTATPVEGFDSVELFSAMSDGEIEVVIRTKNAAEANLVVKNNSDRPLAIAMPATFSAVPVMRQFGGGGFGGGGQGGGRGGQGGQGGIQQGIGGGVGGGQGGGGQGGGGFGGGGGQGGGVFNIPPGRSGRLQLATICLEEGKPDPQSRIDYKIQPLEDLNSDPKIAEMCRMLANDEISQPVAQAAAWNVTDGLSWQELLVKNRVERMDGYFERYFQPGHIRFAQAVVSVATERAAARKKANAETKSDYSSETQYKTGTEPDTNQ